MDPVYYGHAYWLVPDGESAERAYRLLVAAMEAQDKVGIGTDVMRTKQDLAAIRPARRRLAMPTMRFADEVVPQSEIDALPEGKAKPGDQEMKLASQIIDSLSTDRDPARYHDTYTEQLEEMIEAKAKGKEIVAEEEAPAEASVIDLMAALEASLEAARKGGGRRLATEVAEVTDRLAGEEEPDDGDEGDDGAKGATAAKTRSPAKKAPAKKKAPAEKAAPKPSVRKKTA